MITARRDTQVGGRLLSAHAPNFVHLGTDKAGSTWISNVLDEHPAAYIAPGKDLYYFTTEYWRGRAWYESHFRPQTEVAIRAEVCHDYMYSRLALQRISRDLPDVQVAVVLRDPWERTRSSIINHWRSGKQDSAVKLLGKNPSIIENSMYATPVQDVLDIFRPEQLRILTFDMLEADPRRFMCRLTDFASLDFTDEHLAAGRRPAAVARSSTAASAAKWSAERVRSAGLPNLVGRVKRNAVVNRMMYREADVDQGAIDDAMHQHGCGELFAADLRRLSPLVDLPEISGWLRALKER